MILTTLYYTSTLFFEKNINYYLQLRLTHAILKVTSSFCKNRNFKKIDGGENMEFSAKSMPQNFSEEVISRPSSAAAES